MSKVQSVQVAVAVFGLLSVAFMMSQFGISIEQRQHNFVGISLVLAPYAIYILVSLMLGFRASLIGGLLLVLPSIVWSFEAIFYPDPLSSLAYLFGVVPFQVSVLIVMAVLGLFMKARSQWTVGSDVSGPEGTHQVRTRDGK